MEKEPVTQNTFGGTAKAYGRPRPTSLPYLDLNQYRKNTNVVACFKDWTPGWKLQIMAKGERRFLFDQRGNIIEVTDPLHPTLFNKNAYARGGPQLA